MEYRVPKFNLRRFRKSTKRLSNSFCWPSQTCQLGLQTIGTIVLQCESQKIESLQKCESRTERLLPAQQASIDSELLGFGGSLKCWRLIIFFCTGLLFVSPALFADDDADSAGLEFFENKIRPVLVEKCYDCHSNDAKSLKGGLLLEHREQLLAGGDSGAAINLKKPAESLIVESLKWESYEMPPEEKLSDEIVKDFEHWISIGAPWPKSDAAPLIKTNATYNWKKLQSEHWSFRPVGNIEVPKVDDESWAKNPIDHFVLRKLNENSLKPAPPAEPHVLVRRIYFDLIGLPPTPKQVQQFVASFKSDSEVALSKLINGLLESPHYGERWGRHWLDVARYSDGFGGFNDNRAMNDAWRYRDWVVEKLNSDMPFEDFIRSQIAGDLVKENPDPIATGFLALGPTYNSDGGDPDSVAQAKSETLDDRVDTLSRGLMGITASCSRCHDHKFDPIPQMDYYSLAGVFNNTAIHDVPLVAKDVVDQYNAHQQKVKEKNKELQKLNQLIKNEKRKATDEETKKIQVLNEELETLRKSALPKFPTAHALRDSGNSNMKVAIRGDLRKTGSEAPRRFLRIIAGEDPKLFVNGSGRLELADSIARQSNPLTTRVFVNRVWRHHFGEAIVRTPGNFGKLGEPPSHPELLDWLANRFWQDGGSLKSLHRVMMTSATYRMSSQYDEAAFEKDGANQWLWRVNPRRLDVEAWRDALLSVTGEIELKLGGPPTEDINSRRRTLYFKVSRGGDRFASDEFLRTFDFPMMRATVAQRPTSIVPQQYLFMLNSNFMRDRSVALHQKLNDFSKSDSERITFAYQLLFARIPTEKELSIGLRFISGEKESEAEKVGAWQNYCQALLSSNEFLFLN